MRRFDHISVGSDQVLSFAHRAFASIAERMINTRLRMNPEVAANLYELSEKMIGLEITTLGLRTFFTPDTESEPLRIRVEASSQSEPTTWIRGSIVNLIKMTREGHRSGAQLEISGDIGAGETFQHILREAELDWEELLAQFVGDIPAHQVGKGANAINRCTRRAINSVAFSAGEYLREEIDLAVDARQINKFIDQVDRLRDDVSRLVARVDRLRGKHR